MAVFLPNPASGKNKLYALDFPHSKGRLREEQIGTSPSTVKRVFETLKPAIISGFNPSDIAPEIYDHVVAEGLQNRCYIPLVNHGRALGLLVIARTSETPAIWAARYLKMNGKGRLLGSFNHGPMDNALPQAIGAQATYPDRQESQCRAMEACQC